MGWTKYRAWTDANGRVDRKAECDKVCTWERKDDATGEVISSGRVLKSRMVWRVYYAAVELKNKSRPEPYVGALVFLTCGKAYRDDNCNFGYKDMDETMEPFYYDCPESILALLSPTEDECALRWRKACHERNFAKKNKTLDMFDAPKCLTVEKRKGSSCWVVSSRSYRANSAYCGVRYCRGTTKRDAAMMFWERHCPLMRFSAYNKAMRKCINAA